MVGINQYENVRERERDAELTEFIFDEEEPDVVYEDVLDEDDLPPDWEDLIYESWRDQQEDKRLENRK
jgi:hypothetical protein